MTAKERKTYDELILRCVQLHENLMRAGLYGTGHAMHEVVRKIGWEVAEKLKKDKDVK